MSAARCLWLMVLAALLLQGGAAFAQERRVGLGGKFATRRLTVAQNSLALFAGPGQTPLIGQRFGDYVPDGGFAYQRQDLAGMPGATQSVGWARAGVAFGLWDNIEAGALFLSFRLTPDFAYYDFPVYITYSWTFDNVDIGARLSFLTPAKTGNFALNPGLPVLVRLGNARIDTGVFVPVLFQDPTVVGLTVPVRLLYNATPALFFALSSGLSEPNFAADKDLSLPLGALFGYTLLAGSRVLDLSASLQWDRFLLLDAPSGVDAVQAGAYSVMLGVTLNSLVM